MRGFMILMVIIIPLFSYGFNNDSIADNNTAVDTVKRLTFNSLSLVSIAQNAFVNWAAGGESSLSGKGEFDYDLKYQKDNFTFDQSGNLVFGLVGYIDRRIEKTNDKLNLAVAFSHQTSKKWSLTNITTLKTQFANGYKYPDDSTLISAFFAPAYLKRLCALHSKSYVSAMRCQEQKKYQPSRQTDQPLYLAHLNCPS